MNHKYHNMSLAPMGQTLVEFALVLPILLLLLLGFFDLGRAFFYYSSLSNAVREGARAGIVMATLNETAIKQEVRSYGFGLALTDDDILLDYDLIDKSNLYLKVTAEFCFVPVTPGISALIGNNCSENTLGIPLTAESSMRIEQ